MLRVWAGSRRPGEASDAYRRKIAIETRRLADLAGEKRILLVFEYHNGSLTEAGDSCAALMEQVDHPNVTTYWQPTPELDVEENLASLSVVSPWLAGLHVFHWRPTHLDRHPLSDGESDWIRYLELASTPRVRLVHAAAELRVAALTFKTLVAPAATSGHGDLLSQ